MSFVHAPGKLHIPLENPGRSSSHLEVKAYYRPGGLSNITGRTEARGVVLSVGLVGIDANGMILQAAGSGVRCLLESWSRLNRKKLAEIGNSIATQIEARQGPIWEYVQAFCQANGIVFAAEQPVV